MEKSQITFSVRATGAGLALTVVFDGQEIFTSKNVAQAPLQITQEFDDDQTVEHCLEITLSGKLQDHTKINDVGGIISDRVIEIENFSLGDVELKHLLSQTAQYHHDNNGDSDLQSDEFFGTMGCNGTVKLRFSSPVYLWLLENM
jgi:hypothetical protein